MSQIVKLEKQIEIKSSPEKFFNFFKTNIADFPQKFPTHIKGFEYVNDSALKSGTITSWKYSLDGSSTNSAKLKIEEIDDANKSITYSVVEGQVMDWYKSSKDKFQVFPGYVRVWKEVEKASPDSPNPSLAMEHTVKVFKAIDSHLSG